MNVIRTIKNLLRPRVLDAQNETLEGRKVDINSILNSWIMVEHLSEGDINLKDNNLYRLDDLKEENFHHLFQSEIKSKKIKKDGGLVFYVDIFKFEEVISFLRDKFELSESDEDILYGKKFGFALYFDKNLNYDKDKFFFTESAYMRYFKKVPDEKKFREFEEEQKEKFAQKFDETASDPEKFNRAIKEILSEHKISEKDCRFHLVNNLDTDATNLHSFFIDDLKKAKSSHSSNLQAYLFGGLPAGRINLDSERDSTNFNPSALEDILSPGNYPLGRFISNPKYALSFMQQIAVNLAISNYDPQSMQSVNGPPGTGKTTLLKDIFAELVVKQAHDIASLKDHLIKGTANTIYDEKASIGEIPSAITENSIVVASSNNGAVQNIVNELPLAKDVDERFKEILGEVDYFKEVANANIKQEESHTETGKEEKYWGLFSLEGGKSNNMTNILNRMECVHEYLENEYKADETIYRRFEEQYETVKKARSGSLTGKPLDLNLTYEDLQLSNPWFDETYRVAQAKLFVLALGVRKQFLYDNRKNIGAAIEIWGKQNSYLENKRVIHAAWHWINMTIPVISSTFASFSRMMKNIDENVLGHVFVDEAGQALPQAAVGAIWRSRKLVVVGDPFQIKPVLTLDASILAMLGKHHGVGEKYLSDSASVQTLVDSASKYGFYTEKEDESSWIGIPLWVHRRCQYPMFTISNEISYHGLMVQGVEKYGKTGWFDITGKAHDKYVKEQGEFLKKKLQAMIRENPKITDKNEKDTVYIISPFRNVARQLSQDLKSIGFTRQDSSKKVTNIGTIHTFQGKEAPIVFMVLGADEQSTGAASWAVREANMMNVAATRAKEEFYIIGDKNLYQNRISSEIIRKTSRIIADYKKEHPELVEEECFPMQNALSPQAEKICPECGHKMKLRTAKRGSTVGKKFWGCSSYPDCKHTEEKEEPELVEEEYPPLQNEVSPPAEKICPECGHKMKLRTAKKGAAIGKKFWGCSSYPDCKHTEKHNGE